MNDILTVIWSALGASIILLAKAGIEKITARIKNVPDAKARRVCNADEHHALEIKLDEALLSLERLARLTEENMQLRADNEEKDAAIAKLRKDLSNALKLKEQVGKKV